MLVCRMIDVESLNDCLVSKLSKSYTLWGQVKCIIREGSLNTPFLTYICRDGGLVKLFFWFVLKKIATGEGRARLDQASDGSSHCTS